MQQGVDEREQKVITFPSCSTCSQTQHIKECKYKIRKRNFISTKQDLARHQPQYKVTGLMLADKQVLLTHPFLTFYMNV